MAEPVEVVGAAIAEVGGSFVPYRGSREGVGDLVPRRPLSTTSHQHPSAPAQKFPEVDQDALSQVTDADLMEAPECPAPHPCKSTDLWRSGTGFALVGG